MKPRYCQYCGEPVESRCNCLREIAEAEAQFVEEYENAPMVQYGWCQQDAIELWRFER